ncbi:NAD(P)-dependent alcohol dehydrogenase [Mongoliitalea daihaiensis]|uniref:NAD(P)-dependent alcohol dehydrogenase n=1 Tax=Mongoliitalea daihaiensis TaxID=2782006 RepID=UPI001F267CC5|nr:NAD(P)-dependent alcohol dehydrogenase [Mongoliitalea daihaiensis]UJP65101.1 NAD(P)-dependent alcohol dehydrogenase [Mongoliitalea daihaiensis]
MKAALCTAYGGPEVLKIAQVPKPQPKSHEVLIAVKATAVNSGDVRVRGLVAEGIMKVFMRLAIGITKPRNPILGTVFAGEIEAIGAKVTKFKVGDQVFGMTGFKFGTHAEYLCISENGNLFAMPSNTSYEEAASLIFGGQTAIFFLEFLKKLPLTKPRVLILGATGSVGVAAVQVARYYGAEVTAVCSSDGLSLVKRLGLEYVITYDADGLQALGGKFDFILDAVGKYSKNTIKPYLAARGVFKTVGGFEYASESVDQLKLIKKLAEEQQLTPVIDKVFSLEAIADAHQYVDSGRKKGNVVVVMGY